MSKEKKITFYTDKEGYERMSKVFLIGTTGGEIKEGADQFKKMWNVPD